MGEAKYKIVQMHDCSSLHIKTKKFHQLHICPPAYCLQVWPQWRASKVLVLIWRKDPRARQEKARLDREVGGLEPFLEAMPTYIVCNYMFRYLQVGCHKVLEKI